MKRISLFLLALCFFSVSIATTFAKCIGEPLYVNWSSSDCPAGTISINVNGTSCSYSSNPAPSNASWVQVGTAPSSGSCTAAIACSGATTQTVTYSSASVDLTKTWNGSACVAIPTGSWTPSSCPSACGYAGAWQTCTGGNGLCSGSASYCPATGSCAVNGLCSGSHYSCNAGISASNGSSGGYWTWYCNGTGGGSDSPQCTELQPCGNGSVNPPTCTPRPTAVTLSADDLTVSYGDSTIVRWGSASANNCTGYNVPAWNGPKTVSGNQSTGSLTSATTYGLYCSNLGGDTYAPTVTVNVCPVGNPTWNGTACVNIITGVCGGSNNTCSVGSLNNLADSGTNYQWQCDGNPNDAGHRSPLCTQCINGSADTPTCTPIPTLSFSSDAVGGRVNYNGSVNLTWVTGNSPTVCSTGVSSWAGLKNTAGDTENRSGITSIQTFTLQCSNAGGSSALRSVTITPCPIGTPTWNGSSCVVDVTGSCGVSNNSCPTGSLNNLADSGTNYQWQCDGTPNDAGHRSPLCTQCINGSADTPTCTPIPTLSLMSDAVGGRVNYNGNVNLTWVTGNSPSTCTATNGWTGSKNTAGDTENRSGITSAQTFNLQCSNAGGSSVLRSVTITPCPVGTPYWNGTICASVPVATLTLNGSTNLLLSKYPGVYATIAWDGTTGATPTSCIIPSGNWSNPAATALPYIGSGNTDPLPVGATSFSYACGNGAGTTTAIAVATVCASATPVNAGGVCRGEPVAGLTFVSGNYTPSATVRLSCSNSAVYRLMRGATVVASGAAVGAPFVLNQVITIPGDYTLECDYTSTDGHLFPSVSNALRYRTAPTEPVVSITATPISISKSSATVLSWIVMFPNSVQSPVRVPGCMLRATPVCTGTCTADQLTASTTVNNILSTGETDANDPAGKRLISDAVNEVAFPGPGSWKAQGKKTMVLDKSMNFKLDCGGSGTQSSSTVRVIVKSTNEG